MKRCLFCYQLLDKTDKDFHAACSKKIFAQPFQPLLPYNEKNMEKLASQIIQSHISVPGVQPKLSLHLGSSKKNEPRRFTLVGFWGDYILKPPTQRYPQLVEVEDLTMHLASIAKIKVVPHTLIRLQSGSLAYITKRIDRYKKEKIHMEDMCQLTGRLTEDKYHGSYEQIAKAIMKYSASPGLDTVNYYEQVLFCFLTGNADMHLKNFSLIYQPGIGPILSPGYDMVATALVNPEDTEDLALTLNGKKRKINRFDFIEAFKNSQLEPKQQENIFNKMKKSKQKWFNFIEISFLKKELKDGYKNLIQSRFKRLS